jgi:hypothetical protein
MRRSLHSQQVWPDTGSNKKDLTAWREGLEYAPSIRRSPIEEWPNKAFLLAAE